MWQVIGASTRGTSHIRGDIPCQDAHGYRMAGDTLVAVVADGLGSATCADEGARLATERALEVLTSAFETTPTEATDDWTALLRDAFLKAREQLETTAKDKGLALRDFGTTLLAVAVSPHRVGVGHIGDGAAVILLENGTVETLSPPQRGEYANEVLPLTAIDAVDLVRIELREETIKGVALLTDGLQNLCINTVSSQAFKPFFEPFFEAVCRPLDVTEASRALDSFLSSEAVCRKTDDDKTLVVIGRLKATEESSSTNEEVA